MPGVFNDEEATSLLRERFAPKIVDQIFQSNPLFKTLYEGRSTFDGGRTLSHPVMYEGDIEGEGGEFDVSDETFSTETADAFNVSSFRWKAYQFPIKIHEIEIAEFGNSDARAINLLAARSQRAAMALSSRLGKHLFKEAGVGPKQIHSLNDAFAQANVYGGIDRSQASNSWWQTKQQEMHATTATALTLRKVHDTIEDCSEGAIRPTFGITDLATYSKIWDLALTNQRYGDTRRTVFLGFPAIEVDGVPIIRMKQADNDGSDGANTKRKIRFLNTDFWEFSTHSAYDFFVRPFRLVGNDGVVWVARIFWMGNVYTTAPRYNGELINILA